MRRATLLLTLAFSGNASASLLTLSNPVADGAIDTSAGSDRSDWALTTAFPTDPDEGNTTDFASITAAHDSTNFYLREQLYRTSNSGFFSTAQIVLFDTDQSSGTGYTGPAGAYSIGAEYLLEGLSLYSFTGGGSQTSFSWSFVTSVVYDDFPLNDHELTMSRANLGNPVSFDLIALTDYFGNGDIYPDSALGGGSGGSYTYTTAPTAVPEATEGLVLLLGFLGLATNRRRRSSALAGTLPARPTPVFRLQVELN